MRSLGALLVASLVGLALVLAPTAGAVKNVQPGIHDDAQILNGDPEVIFPQLAKLNTKLIRVTLWWGGPGIASHQGPRSRRATSRPTTGTRTTG